MDISTLAYTTSMWMRSKSVGKICWNLPLAFMWIPTAGSFRIILVRLISINKHQLDEPVAFGRIRWTVFAATSFIKHTHTFTHSSWTWVSTQRGLKYVCIKALRLWFSISFDWKVACLSIRLSCMKIVLFCVYNKFAFLIYYAFTNHTNIIRSLPINLQYILFQ